ncbi:hypothetical protein CFP56_004134, partial [Quercus suber]
PSSPRFSPLFQNHSSFFLFSFLKKSKEEDLLRASSVANYGRQKYNSIPNYKNNENHEYATLIEERDTYYGMNAEINMWNPQVQEQNEFSLAQFWKEGIDNNGVTLYTIEASAMAHAKH